MRDTIKWLRAKAEYERDEIMPAFREAHYEQAADLIESLQSKLDKAEKVIEACHEEIDHVHNLHDAAESRLDRALEALRNIDRSDPRYDANEVHTFAKEGQGFKWNYATQEWLTENGGPIPAVEIQLCLQPGCDDKAEAPGKMYCRKHAYESIV